MYSPPLTESIRTIQAIQFNRELKEVPAKDALMIRFGRALFREHKVSPELYAEVVKTFGQRGTVEAAWIMGDYAMAAVALRAVDQRNLPILREPNRTTPHSIPLRRRHIACRRTSRSSARPARPASRGTGAKYAA